MEMATQCGAFRTRHLARVLTRRYDEALRPYDLSLAQLEILGSLAARGHASLSTVAGDTGAERSTISRMIKALEQADLLVVARTSTGRAREASLTEAGRDRFVAAHEAWRQVNEVTAAVLGAGGVASLGQWIAELEESEKDAD